MTVRNESENTYSPYELDLQTCEISSGQNVRQHHLGGHRTGMDRAIATDFSLFLAFTSSIRTGAGGGDPFGKTVYHIALELDPVFVKFRDRVIIALYENTLVVNVRLDTKRRRGTTLVLHEGTVVPCALIFYSNSISL